MKITGQYTYSSYVKSWILMFLDDEKLTFSKRCFNTRRNFIYRGDSVKKHKIT